MANMSLKKVASFLAANAKSPVVYGSVLSLQRGGAHYRLKDGTTFELNRKECQAIGAGNVKWAI